MIFPEFDHIYIDEKSLSAEVTTRVKKIYAHVPTTIVTEEPGIHIKGHLTPVEFNQSKKQLYLTEYKGQFFKRCPGATQKKTLTCCNYHVLNLGSQCNMNCSYCYLQSYLNSRVTKIFTNVEQALTELTEMAEEHPNQPFRVGTGEVIDSLSLDAVTLYSRKLITFFKKYPNWVLEFKTKSSTVDQFLDLDGTPNIVVSWSINPAEIINSEEHGTACYQERLNAAVKCRNKGYRVAFHIDPMIWHTNWKKNYALLAKDICSRFSEKDIQAISIGALRFQPEQRHMMRERFGVKSLVNQAEMFLSENGKMRYDSSIRAEMYHFMQSELRQHNPNLNIFLCMETPETWIKAFDKIPMQMPELKELFRPLPQVR